MGQFLFFSTIIWGKTLNLCLYIFYRRFFFSSSCSEEYSTLNTSVVRSRKKPHRASAAICDFPPRLSSSPPPWSSLGITSLSVFVIVYCFPFQSQSKMFIPNLVQISHEVEQRNRLNRVEEWHYCSWHHYRYSFLSFRCRFS